MIAAVTLVVAGTPATSFDPLKGLPAVGGQLFQPSPRVTGSSVASCGGLSPLSNACSSLFREDACRTAACWPNVKGGLGYTGSITASVWGKDRYGVDRFVSWTCDYIAGSSTQVGSVVSGGCRGASNAPYECNVNTATGLTECGNWLWPPFRLAGAATPPVSGSAPVSSWTAAVERS